MEREKEGIREEKGKEEERHGERGKAREGGKRDRGFPTLMMETIHGGRRPFSLFKISLFCSLFTLQSFAV